MKPNKVRFWCLQIIFLLLLSLSNTQALDWKKKLRNPASEFLGAIVGELIVGVGTGYLVKAVVPLDGDLAPTFVPIALGYIFGASVGAPLGTELTAKYIDTEGSGLGAFVGGISATIIGVYSFWNLAEDEPGIILVSSVLLLPPLCSVIGYNLHKSGDKSHSSFPNNFPQIGLSVVPEKHDNKITPNIGLSIKLGIK